MIDSRFYTKSGTHRLIELAQSVSGTVLRGDRDFVVQDVSAIQLAAPGDLIFYNHHKFKDELAASNASVCVTHERYTAHVPEGMAIVLTSDPERAFAAIAAQYYPSETRAKRPDGTAHVGDACDISPTAILGPNVRIGSGTRIDDYAVIEEGAVIGPNSYIGPHTLIGRNTQIGAQAAIESDCAVRYAVIGDRFELDAGSKLGMQGFKFIPSQAGLVRFPQLGLIEIGNDVAIEANCVVERGSLGNTTIGSGTKIGNAVAIGHGAEIGEHCVIVAMSGIGGSAILGNRVVLGAQVGIRDGVTLADDVKVGGQSGVVTDELEAGMLLEGSPAVRITPTVLKERLRQAREAGMSGSVTRWEGS